MAIKQKQGIDNLEQKVAERYRKACIMKFMYVGEQCVRNARLTGSYTDRTGNLRSSVGYVIVDNGKVIKESDFDTVKTGSEGVNEGRGFAHELAKQHVDGLALIVVAGMNYASYVQRRGYNVLASAELIAEQMVKQLKLNA